jgi:hypothetical protein
MYESNFEKDQTKNRECAVLASKSLLQNEKRLKEQGVS